MAVTRIILWIGYALVMMAGLMGLALLGALFLFDYQTAVIMVVTGLAVLVFGALLIFSTAQTPSRESNSDALLFLLLFWIFIPLIGAIPFLVYSPDIGWIQAYFEAVSMLTTSGASSFIPENLPPAMLLWQAILQFFGGVSVATLAVVILAALNLTGTGVHRSNLFTLRKGELFERLMAIGRVVFGIYLFIASLCFILMTVSGTQVFDALCLSLSAVATGGMTPRSDDLALYIPRISAFVLAITCALGAMNVSVVWDVLRQRNIRNIRRIFTNIEHRTLLSISAALFLLGILYAGLQNIYPVFLEAIFFISSAGFIYDAISLEQIPSVILIAIALIGGSALSTAGGLKVIRIVLLMRHLSTDIKRLSHPSRVLPVTFRNSAIPDRAFLSIWMYFFGYTLVFGLSILCFGAVGLDFVDATAASAASLANMGLLLPATLPESGLTWVEMTPSQMMVSSMLMLIGRVEVLAVFALLTPSFWKEQ